MVTDYNDRQEMKKKIRKIEEEKIMKRIMRRWAGITFAILFCVVNAVPAMAASSQYSAAVSNYRSYMRQQNGRYKIADIDGNGIPELLAHTWRNEVYTYNLKTGKRICLGAIAYGKGYNLPITYSQKCHTVMLCSYNTGGGIKEIYKINGLKSTRVVRTEAFNGKFESGYKVNGKKVNQSVYNKKISIYMKNAVDFNVR